MAPPSDRPVSPRLLYETRAGIELATGDIEAALNDARTALAWARYRQAATAPDCANRVGLDQALDETFSVLIEAGNRVYCRTRNPELLRETFEAVEENRAESLEAMLPARGSWRASVSTAPYRSKLTELLAEQSVVLRVNSPENRERFSRLETELSQMEADGTQPTHAGTVLARIHRNLPKGAALLSFRLGDRKSWLWTVDHGQLRLYELPRKAILQKEIEDFRAAIARNDVGRIGSVGHRLYQDLLGGPERSYQKCLQWFISLDEPLYTLPFPSLVVETGKPGPVYLTQRARPCNSCLALELLDAPESGPLAGQKLAAGGRWSLQPRGSALR